MPDMRKKVEEYIKELDAAIELLEHWIEEHMNINACAVSEAEGKLKAYLEIRNDLQSRLDELID